MLPNCGYVFSDIFFDRRDRCAEAEKKKIVNINFLSLILNYLNRILECIILNFNKFFYTSKIVISGISGLMVISVIIFFTVKSYINLNIQQSNKIVYHANTSIKNTLMQKFWFFRNEREKTHINKSNAEK
jgi:hypothetical protein